MKENATRVALLTSRRKLPGWGQLSSVSHSQCCVPPELLYGASTANLLLFQTLTALGCRMPRRGLWRLVHWLCCCCGIEKAEESKLLQPLLPEDHSGLDPVEDGHSQDDDEDEQVRPQPSAGTY